MLCSSSAGYAERANTLLTDLSYQRPPRGVAIPRALGRPQSDEGSTRALKCASKGSRLKLTVVRKLGRSQPHTPEADITMSKLGCHGVNGTFKAVKGHRLAP